MAYTVPEIINIAKVSQYLAARDAARGALFGQRPDPKLPLLLFMESELVEWGYEQSKDDITATAAYLFNLCGGYGTRAAALIAQGVGGTVVTPSVPDGSSATTFDYLIPFTAADFADATAYNDTRLVGHRLEIFWNEVNRYLTRGTEWAYTPTGIEILIEGFDATLSVEGGGNGDATFKAYILDPTVAAGEASSSGTSGDVVEFAGDGTYDIPAMTRLDYFIVIPSAACTLKVGTTLGGEEVLPEVALSEEGDSINVGRFWASGATLYLTGLPAGSTVIFYTTTVTL